MADAISAATDILSAGDVLLIEQQGYVDNLFCPVEVEPAVFDAIALAVAKGIIVVEPTGNGSINLDGSDWGDWFNPDVQDSGAMMVGGGASPLSGYEPRTWYPNGSAYGRRVDLKRLGLTRRSRWVGQEWWISFFLTAMSIRPIRLSLVVLQGRLPWWPASLPW